MRKKLDFKQIATELNGVRVANKKVSAIEFKEYMAMVGLPISSGFRQELVEFQAIIPKGRGSYEWSAEPIHYMTIEKALNHFHNKRNAYRVKYSKKTAAEAPETNKLEDAIQRAIKLLKDQGDRFQITEKVVTIQYKEV